MCTSVMTGLATLHSRVTRYQHQTNLHPSLKRLSSQAFLEYLIQKRISPARIKNWLVIVQGDFNRSLQFKINPTSLETWMKTNRLVSPDFEHLQHLPGYHTRNSGGATQTETAIDHSMHTPLPKNVLLEELGVVNWEERKQFSDHLPVWIRFTLTSEVRTVPIRNPLQAPPRLELDPTNEKNVKRYQETLIKNIGLYDKPYRELMDDKTVACSSDASATALQMVMADTVLATHDPKSRQRDKQIQQSGKSRSTKKKNGYSGDLAVLVAHKSFYENLIRIAFPSGRRRMRCKWNGETYQVILTKVIQQWRTFHRDKLDAVTAFSPVRAVASPTALQQLNFHEISLEYLLQQITQIKGLLQGKRRATMRDEQNANLHEREELRKIGQLGKLIELLTCNPPNELDLQTLPCPTAGQIADHYVIQRTLNEYFQGWYAIPTDLDPAATRLATDPVWHSALYVYVPEVHDGVPLHPESNIPVDMQEGLRKVCSQKASDETSKIIEEAIYADITYEHFDEALVELKTGSAPGPSRVTANMIKAWPRSTKIFVYKHMTNIWKSRTIPIWFKDKLMKLAPKIPGNDQLDNMRPISLYEIIRKIWTTIVARRINRVWHEKGLLHDAQYGYRLDNGTQMALFNVINEIEGANVRQETKFVTFWDIRRAFDSVPRYLQLLAWRRLGVPADVADWFVELDTNGSTFISTPLYNTERQMSTLEEIQQGVQHMVSLSDQDEQQSDLSFQAERGIGQGESASSLMWIALYDILLEWIDPANRFLHTSETQLSYSNEDIEKTKMSAYADDLCTITGGPNGAYMQTLQAKWLSAFCAFTGLELHPKKIKPTIVGPVRKHHLKHLKVYNHQWELINCPILPELETYKYLGVQLDLRNKPLQSFHRLLETATTSLSHLMNQVASPTIKIDYIRFKIIPIVLYTAVCSNWTLAQYRKLDVPFSQNYRKILCLPEKSPTALLYLPQSMAGIGLPKVSDLAQIRKWEWFQRCSAVNGNPGASIESMLNRVPAQPQLNPEDPVRLLPCPAADQWTKWPLTARSLLEWAGESGLQLAQREVETSEEEIHNRNNQDTITELAQLLDFWPDPRRATTTEDLTPLRLFATDGSYKAEPDNAAEILTSESIIRDKGKGAGGIVFFPHNTYTPVHGVQITSNQPEPGMNAFTWELLTQVIAIQMTQYQPHYLPGFSDCTSAITRSNLALRSFINPLAHTRGGLWASAAHVHANCDLPRRFTHIKAHPERDPKRKDNPTIKDIAIYMADAVAGQLPTAAAHLPNGLLRLKLGKTKLKTTLHSLKLENVMNEIIPLHQWHFRTADENKTPVLNDLRDYQDRASLKAMTETRDTNNNEQRWTSTALSFASKIHPPKDPSFWAAARRALIIYDWVGHGRNRGKQCNLHPAQRTQVEKCPHCTKFDDQAHCMLECTHTPFNALRTTAQYRQAVVGRQLTEKYSHDKDMQHFVQQLCHASWTASPNISRIWLGTWSMHTLQQILGQPMDSSMTMKQRYTYIDIAKKLTAPLLVAYSAMININTRLKTNNTSHEEEALPLYDHLPSDTHTDLPITDPFRPEYSEDLAERIHEIELSFEQDNGSSDPGLSLQRAHALRQNEYDISDAAALIVSTDSDTASNQGDADRPF
jgi:hypothetical protein